MNILITGGAGFIGSHLSEMLIETGHHQVYCLDNFSTEDPDTARAQNISDLINHSQFTLFETDITDFPGLKAIFDNYSFDHIVHLAGLSHVKESLEDPLRYSRVNIMGTHNILELSRLYHAKNIIFASSHLVYGNKKSLTFTEEDPCDKPLSPYAATMIAAETLCKTYHHLYDMNFVILRLASVYGPRQKSHQTIHQFSGLIYDNIAIPQLMDGSGSEDYIHVDDVTDSIIRGIEWLDTRSQPEIDIYNIGSSTAQSEKDIITLLERELNTKAIIKWLPEPREKAVDRILNIARAERNLGFSPRIPIETGIADFINWFRQTQTG